MIINTIIKSVLYPLIAISALAPFIAIFFSLIELLHNIIS